MLQLIGRRLLATVPLLLAVSMVVFSFVHLLPGDPAVLFLGEEATPDNLARFRAKLGFDRPLVVQDGGWLRAALQGDLGRSIRSNQPVTQAIVERLPVTLRLIGLSMLISLCIAVPLGVISAVKRNSGVDLASTFFALVYCSALALRWLPPSGFEGVRSLVLPSITLGTALAALVTRQLRSGMLEVLRQDYMRTAQAKGLADRVAMGKHALKNALI